MMEREGICAVVVAAGRGSRFGRPYNKIFHELDGETVLSRCLRALAKAQIFDGGIYCVIAAEEEDVFWNTVEREGTRNLVAGVAAGGKTRTESVLSGLRALPKNTQIVAVHDAARCFVSEGLVRACVESAIQFGSGVPATPCVDTVKETEGDYAVRTLNRETLCCVQTPQTFQYDRLMDAYRHFRGAATDDAGVYEARFGKVRLVKMPECAGNIKITHPGDGENQSASFRVGMGYDAHRLTEGRKLILCGEEFEFEKGLLGHSDADVAAHALMDALLGAAALGDIGKLFPDSSSEYKGISSMTLLSRVAKLLREKGYRIRNCDVTIVAQSPKLMHRRSQMIANLARAMGVDEAVVSVKATTTEGMGFEGEGLGISASAVALLG